MTGIRGGLAIMTGIRVGLGTFLAVPSSEMQSVDRVCCSEFRPSGC